LNTLRVYVKIKIVKIANMDCCDGIELPVAPSGSNGDNAFTFTSADFTQPAVAANVTVDVLTSGQNTNQFAQKGQIVHVSDTLKFSWYEVVQRIGTTQIELKNLGYTGSASPGDVIASGANVSPAGIIGPAGASGAGAPGADGANGTTRLYQYTGTKLTTATFGAGVWTNISPAISIPANTLVDDGDEVVIKFLSDVSQLPPNGTRLTFRRVMIDGSGVAMVSCTKSSGLNLEPPHEETGVTKESLSARTSVRFIKASSSSLKVVASFDMLKDREYVVESKISSVDFTTAYDLFFEIQQLAANQIGLSTITMDLIKMS
jgi:hypothetical protein